jgi:hypothetical protein
MKQKEQHCASAKQSQKEKGEKMKQYPFPLPPSSMELKEVIGTKIPHLISLWRVVVLLTPLHCLKKLSEVECELEILSREGMPPLVRRE